MGGTKKPTAREAFDLNMDDAKILVELAEMLTNQRRRRMRTEKRKRVGEALRYSQKEWDELECLESDSAFIVFKPGYAHWRERLDERNLRPLLRQAIVAACAAVETFCADRVMERLSGALKLKPPPPRLLELSMTVADYLRIDEQYERTQWGLRQLIELEVREKASTAPSQVGALFALVGEKGLLAKVDGKRGLAKTSTHQSLEEITERRNRIAHQGDRVGHGRATISVQEVRQDLGCLVSIVNALDQLTKAPNKTTPSK
ncbi:HEPN domain-containing protein [Nocardiopsis exhalans]|uniref:HEPN domain-containing protein n=1 Tax=Nocardiopsis exhalans TaxID=163604 RepID=A0ABY5D4V6_9ACTN|nr:HEPN domain-containing protein [Nocardiopsis exhalans]USY18771.1 HEPN domain-containing protein [Nocardiopsis exhalans]